MSFMGKAAIVTGAGGGMGRTIVEQLCAQGADILMIDVKEPPEPMPAGPGRADYARIDLTDAGAVEAAIRSFHESRGRLDHLVNTAGVLWFDRDRSVVEIDLDVWDRVMAINLKSAVHTVRAAVPAMRATGGGSMVHFSTIQCLRGDTKPQDAYQASKAALVALSKSIAIQFAGDQIRSNVIYPGPTMTPMQARWEGDEATQTQVAASIPLGRIGRPEDQAAACLFLLSDAASFVTGTELIVDGGVSALP
ncbi:MAG: SDR family oxidoreductase [Rhodospirillaceae bacterium]|jgi:NAD(P)-dependent dehydrogenase (short-subunit alcohol dehydrogenase family)|nr:SDR family oxidoreductase [Rhodospirillaceae bacterium]MBT6116483.1 SDR family oxidoreductase [Rhodospirillaceae bacterium]